MGSGLSSSPLWVEVVSVQIQGGSLLSGAVIVDHVVPLVFCPLQLGAGPWAVSDLGPVHTPPPESGAVDQG